MKQKGTMKFSGKDERSGLTHYETKSGFYSKRSQEPGLHADDENIQKNCRASKGVNGLASGLNNLLKLYVPGYLDREIYFEFTSRFFKAEPPSRLGRLMTLRDMDAHAGFKLGNAIAVPKITVTATDDIVSVKTEITGHATLEKKQHFYSVHIILVLWNSDNDEYSHAEKYTKWLDPSVALPLRYSFKFDKPANSTEYMVMCCCLRGEEPSEKRIPPVRSLKVMAVGSFDEKAMDEWRAFQIEKRNAVVEKPRREIERDEDLAQDPDE